MPYIIGTLLDNARVGSWAILLQRAIGTGDTSLTHKLGRAPQGYYATRSSSGGVVYDATTGVTLWTKTAIVLRVTVAGTYDLWVF